MDEESLAVPQAAKEAYGLIFEEGKKKVEVLRDCLADKDFAAVPDAWDECIDWLEKFAHESPRTTLGVCEHTLTEIAKLLEG